MHLCLNPDLCLYLVKGHSHTMHPAFTLKPSARCSAGSMRTHPSRLLRPTHHSRGIRESSSRRPHGRLSATALPARARVVVRFKDDNMSMDTELEYINIPYDYTEVKGLLSLDLGIPLAGFDFDWPRSCLDCMAETRTSSATSLVHTITCSSHPLKTVTARRFWRAGRNCSKSSKRGL